MSDKGVLSDITIRLPRSAVKGSGEKRGTPGIRAWKTGFALVEINARLLADERIGGDGLVDNQPLTRTRASSSVSPLAWEICAGS